MKRRALPWLSVIAALSVLALALWFGAQRQPQTGAGERQLLLPELAEQLVDLDRLRIVIAGAITAVTLQRPDSGWVVAERDGWPADVGPLRTWLLGVSAARVLEAKTRRPESYPALGLTDPADPDSKAVQVDMDIGDATRSLIIGHNNPNGRGSFVRVPGQAQSWLTDTDLAIERDPARWLDRSLLSVPPDQIGSVRIERPDVPVHEVVRDIEAEGQPLRLVPLPADRVVNDTALYGIVGFLEGLRLDDVRRAPAPESAPELIATFARSDGFNIRVSLWPDEQADPGMVVMPWAHLSVMLDERVAQSWLAAEVEKDRLAVEAARLPAVGSVTDPDSAGEGIESGEARSDPATPIEVASPPDLDARLAALREETIRARDKVDGWLFKLPAFKLANLRRSPEELLTPAD